MFVIVAFLQNALQNSHCAIFRAWALYLIFGTCHKLNIKQLCCSNIHKYNITTEVTEGFLRKNILEVSFFQNCAIHSYS